VLGLTDPRFNQTTDFQFIPNMDGFPNGRRLEDDVTRIELQAVGGVVLAAIGLWYDDYTVGSPNPVTQDLVDVLTFTTGVEQNDKPFLPGFPFVAQPWNGFEDGAMCDCGDSEMPGETSIQGVEMGLNMAPPAVLMKEIETYPNPASESTTIRYHLINETEVTLAVYDVAGRLVATPVRNQLQKAGINEVRIDVSDFNEGVYFATMQDRDGKRQTVKIVVSK
jgi:hypothetical protein